MRGRLLAAALLLAAGCLGKATDTGFVVEVTTNLSWPDEIDTMQVVVRGAADRVAFDNTYQLGPERPAVALPGKLALFPEGDGDAHLRVEVSAWKSTDRAGTLVTRSATVGFIKHRVLILPMPLLRVCVRKQCDASFTCKDLGACEADTVEPTTLASYAPPATPPQMMTPMTPLDAASDPTTTPDAGGAAEVTPEVRADDLDARDGAIADGPADVPRDTAGEDTGPGATPDAAADVPTDAMAIPVPMCGNGIVETGERCDPASPTMPCPASCPSVGCMLRTLRGTGCAAFCEGTGTQSMCVNGDGCCPPGCSRAQDDDCKKPSGSSCVDPTECESNMCADGVCCTQSCAACQACTGPGGTCQNLPPLAPDDVPGGTCAGTRRCDGQGACKLALGETCAAGAACASGVCQDGVCCDVACTGSCRACNLSASRGTCSPVRVAEDSDTCAGNSLSCDQGGVCVGLSLSPTAHGFGTATVGTTTSPVRVTVLNHAQASATGPVVVSLAGAHPNEFIISANNCGPGPLAAGGSCIIDVRFKPTLVQVSEANLVLTATPGRTLTVSLTGTGQAVAAALGLSPASNDFGNQVLSSTSPPATFTVSNASGAATTGAINIGVTGPFAITGNNCTGASNMLPGGGSCTVQIAFQPMANGPASGSVTASASPGGMVSSSLSGTGTTSISTAPPSISFGTVHSGFHSTTAMVTITNQAGALPAGAPTIAMGGLDPSQFTIASNGCTTPLAGGNSCVVMIQFSPTSTGDKTASLMATSSPGGTASTTLDGTGIPQSSLSFTPSTQNFGSVATGANSAYTTFFLRNEGVVQTGAVSVTFSAGAADFEIGSNACGGSMAPNSTCAVQVRFAPKDPRGAKTGMLSAMAATGASVTATLQGTAVGPLSVAPSPGAFGTVAVGGQGSITFVVTNNGASTLTGMSAQLSGGDASQFVFVSNTCSGANLTAGSNCSLVTRFFPTSAGVKGTTLVVGGFQGPIMETVNVSLSGTGQ